MTVSTPQERTTLLRRPQVLDRTGLSKSGLYKLISEKRFPAPVKLTDTAVAWPEKVVQAWIESLVSAR